jgi:CheY-specific phosphatase CheX
MSTIHKTTLSEIVSSADFELWCNEAMNGVFHDMFEVEIKPEKADSPPPTVHEQEVSAVVAFMNSDIEAVLQVSCSRSTVKKFAQLMNGGTEPEITDYVFLGEIVNIVFGILKDKMNLFDLYYDKCLPIVVIGQDHIILNLNKSEAFSRNYASDVGLFNLKIGFNKKKILSKAA